MSNNNSNLKTGLLLTFFFRWLFGGSTGAALLAFVAIFAGLGYYYYNYDPPDVNKDVNAKLDEWVSNFKPRPTPTDHLKTQEEKENYRRVDAALLKHFEERKEEKRAEIKREVLSNASGMKAFYTLATIFFVVVGGFIVIVVIITLNGKSENVVNKQNPTYNSEKDYLE